MDVWGAMVTLFMRRMSQLRAISRVLDLLFMVLFTNCKVFFSVKIPLPLECF